MLPAESTTITSVQNKAVKAARQLQRRRHRRQQNALLLEGPNLVTEALAANLKVRQVFYTGRWAETEAGQKLLGQLQSVAAGAPVQPVTEKVLASLATTRTPQGLVAVVQRPDPGNLQSLPLGRPLLGLDGVQDPANVGAILRSAFAFGAAGAFMGADSADPYQPKALRAAAGMALRLPLITAPDLAASLSLARRLGRPVLGLAAAGGTPLSTLELKGAGPVLVVGSEGQGLSQPVLDCISQLVTIPLRPGAESLNAAVAASVVLYELARQQDIN